MPPPNLPFVAAQHAFGLLTSEELVQAADAALTSGIYSYSLGALYSLSAVEMPWKASPLFAAALKELGIPLPDKAEAATTLPRHYLCLIAEGAGKPREGLGRFMNNGLSLGEHRASGHGTPTTAWALLDRWFIEYELDAEYLAEGYITAERAQERSAACEQEVAQFVGSWAREQCPVGKLTAALAWNGGVVRALAQAIADECRFDDLPILADALEEAGCNNAAILQHCRWPGEHARRCWAVNFLVKS
jgi:hypothetical protein